MHEDISVVEEMLLGDAARLGLTGDGGDTEPFALENDRGLQPADWEAIEKLACWYGRRLLVLSGTALYEVTPPSQFVRAVEPSDIHHNGQVRAAPQN